MRRRWSRENVEPHRWFESFSLRGWIDDLHPLPRMLQEARKLFGTKEFAGSANNPVILGWAKEVGLAKSYTDDVIPWCGLFMAVVAKRAGKPALEGPLWARNWAAFGQVPARRCAGVPPR